MIDMGKPIPLGAVLLLCLLGAIPGDLWGSGLGRAAKELLLSEGNEAEQGGLQCLFRCPGGGLTGPSRQLGTKVTATDWEVTAVGSSSCGQIVLGSM